VYIIPSSHSTNTKPLKFSILEAIIESLLKANPDKKDALKRKN